jgi:pantetheine-phosphate adenylyltransferase
MVKAIFPGTFDPIHYGHIDIAQRASRLFDQVVVAVYDRPLKNLLFPPQVRIEMVQKSFNDPKIIVMGYSGLTVELCHNINAQVIVRGLRVFSDFEHEFRMALANNRLAKDIEVVALITSEEHTFLSSTTVREIATLNGDISSMVPLHVAREFKKIFLELSEGQKFDHQTSLRD